MIDYALLGPAYPMLRGEGDIGIIERSVGAVIGVVWIFAFGIALATFLMPVALLGALYERVIR
jgi:hypothetical protein